MGAHLPPELIRPIALYAGCHGPHLTVSLILTCRLFQSEAEPVLYRSIDMSHIWDQGRFLEAHPLIEWETFYTSKYTRLLETLKENQRLADLVHIFICRHDYGLVEDERLWSLFNDAIPKLRNLKNFSFRSRSGIPSRRVPDACTFELERFEWQCRGDEEHLLRFLSHQQSLQHLSVIWSDTAPPVPPTILPNLSSLSCSHDAAFAFLPGRNVKELRWIRDFDDPELTTELVSTIASSLERLEALELGGYVSRPELSVFTPYLTGLEMLNLVGVKSGDDSAITSIHSLEHLRLSRRWASSSTRNALWFLDDDDQVAYLASLFDRLERLWVIDVEGTEQDHFYRYLRGQVQSPYKITGLIYEW